MNKTLLACAISALATFTLPATAHSTEFAANVVSSSGLVAPYNNASNALGQPSTSGGGYDFSMVYPDYGKNTSGNESLVELGTAGQAEYSFASPLVYNPNTYYGDAFTLYGNSYFIASGVTATTNMANDHISSSGGIFQNGKPIVTVIGTGASGNALTYTFTTSPTWFPTNPFQWVGNSASDPSGFGALNNYALPVNPDLSLADFAGQSVAYADNQLYDGSAGGASFSWAPLLADGFTTIDDIEVAGSGTGSNVIEGISAVGITPAPEVGTLAFGLSGLALLGIFMASKKRKSREIQ